MPGHAAPPGPWSAPEIPPHASLVALVPATDVDRAAEAAWEFARQAARAGRRVALIDCYVDAPRLHSVTGEPNGDGIVDVFEYGASLSRIARAQPEGTLFFVPAGTFSPSPEDLMARPRWARLSAGFRHEAAVMLLFLPPSCLDVLATRVDGLVVLAPGGDDGGAAVAEVQAALDRGVPLLGRFAGSPGATPPAGAGHAGPGLERQPPVVGSAYEAEVANAAEYAAPVFDAGIPDFAVDEVAEMAAAAEEPPASVEPEPDVAEPAVPENGDEDLVLPGGRLGLPLMRRHAAGPWSRNRRNLFALGLVAAIAGGVYAYRGEFGWDQPPPPSEPAEVPARMVPGPRALVPHAVDSLPFAVQVAAWTTFDQALEDADTVERRGFVPIVTPLLVDRARWYRVYAGPVATQDAADSLLRAVRGAGLDGSSSATTSLVPLSIALKRVATLPAARAERARLRGLGVATFVLGQADGSYRLYTGAFASAEQAAYLDTLLADTRTAGPLIPRVGYRP